MIELDRKVFELCKPEGVIADGDYLEAPVNVWTGTGIRPMAPWSPSTRWEDLEPEIRKACDDEKHCFACTYRPDKWYGEFTDLPQLIGNHVGFGESACEAAVRALIALKESEAKP